MNRSQLKREVLRAMRGKLSQSRVSQKMGFTFNQVYRWEANTASMSWLDFLDYSAACRKDVRLALRKVIKFQGDPRNSGDFFKFLTGNEKPVYISKRTGKSRFVVGRWLSGKTCPSIDVIFEILESVRYLLPEFLAALVDINKVPSLAELYARHGLKNAIYNEPFLEAIISILGLDSYHTLDAHSDSWIARTIGITVSQARDGVATLARAGAIVKENEKYKVITKQIDTTGNPPGSMLIRKYWYQRLLDFAENYQKGQDSTHTGYLVIELSAAAEARVMREYFEFITRVKSIYSLDSGSKTTVKLVGAHVLDIPQTASLTPVSHRLEDGLHLTEEFARPGLDSASRKSPKKVRGPERKQKLKFNSRSLPVRKNEKRNQMSPRPR